MIDFKNYKRVSNLNNLKCPYTRYCEDGYNRPDCKNCSEYKITNRLYELENLIEQGKLVEKSESKTTLTNREYLNNLSNEEFARTIAIKVALSQEPNFNVELKYTEIVNDIQIELENWINEEFKE